MNPQFFDMTARYAREIDMHPSTETRGLSPPTSELDGLLERRERAEGLLRQGIEMIAEASGLTPDRHGGLAKIGMASDCRRRRGSSLFTCLKR